MGGKAEAAVAITGDAWDNASAVATAPAMSTIGFDVVDQTPVLALRGTLQSGDLAVETDLFTVSLKNVATGAIHSAKIVDNQFKLTVVDTIEARAARVGDVLEISTETGSRQFGVETQRHTVSQDDISASLISLPELVTYEIPAETVLLANYPNPFNPETWVPFRLAATASSSCPSTTQRVVRSEASTSASRSQPFTSRKTKPSIGMVGTHLVSRWQVVYTSTPWKLAIILAHVRC